MSKVNQSGVGPANELWSDDAHKHVGELRKSMTPRVSELVSDKDAAPLLSGLLGRLDAMVDAQSDSTKLSGPSAPDPTAVPDHQQATSLLSSASRKLGALLAQDGAVSSDPDNQRRIQKMAAVIQKHVEFKDELLSRSTSFKP